jgi:hypothetical protein
MMVDKQSIAGYISLADRLAHNQMPLINYTSIPAGGYVYSQLDGNGGVIKKFSTTTMPFKQFCAPILALRKANGLERADMVMVMTDVDEAQCVRLNNDPAWCRGGNFNFVPRQDSQKRGCASCGVPLLNGATA